MPYKNPEDKKRYALAHREETKVYWKKYAEENKERRREQARAYNEVNREKIREYNRVRSIKKREHIREIRRVYYERTKEKQLEYARKYRKEHPEKGAERYLRIREAKSNTITTLTSEEIKEMKKVGCFFSDGTCKGYLSVAHDVPFSMGGNATRGNTFILCKRHNSIMHTRSLKEMIVQKSYL